jgi:hypothetical protein
MFVSFLSWSMGERDVNLLQLRSLGRAAAPVPRGPTRQMEVDVIHLRAPSPFPSVRISVRGARQRSPLG